MMDVTMPGDNPKESIKREERLPEPPAGFVDSNTYCKLIDPETGEYVVAKIIDIRGNVTILRQDLVDRLPRRETTETNSTEEDEEMARTRKRPTDEEILRVYKECNGDYKKMAEIWEVSQKDARQWYYRARASISVKLQEQETSTESTAPGPPETPDQEPQQTGQPDPLNGLAVRLGKVEVYIAKERPMLLEDVGQLREQVSNLKLRIKNLEEQPVPNVSLLPESDKPKVEVIAELITALLENESLRRENREIKALVRQGITPRYSEGEADE
jgi:hypothetical protein